MNWGILIQDLIQTIYLIYLNIILLDKLDRLPTQIYHL